MRIAVLSRGPTLYSTRRLVSVARRRGHNVDVLDPLSLSLSVTRGESRIYQDHHEIEPPDAVIPRIGASVTLYGLAVLRHLEGTGAMAINPSAAYEQARDKLRCLQILSSKRIPIPQTAFSRQTQATGAMAGMGQGPLVIKLLAGTQGRGVLLAESSQSATSIIEAFHHLDEQILVQRFVAESAGRDVRAFVVGRHVVASMERQARAGEFRSNLHRGGTARRFQASRALERTAVRATRALGLDVAGVDLLLSKEGPLVLEVNPTPGLEGIEKVTGVNVAGKILDHIEERSGLSRSRRSLRLRA